MIMTIAFVLSMAILVINLIHLKFKEIKYRKELRNDKKKCIEDMNCISDTLNNQIVRNKSLEERLDLFQVSLSKTMADLNDKISLIRDNKITSCSSELTNKEIADVSFQWGLNQLKNKEKKLKKEKIHISKLMVHKEIYKKLGIQWYVLKKRKNGEQEYRIQYTKAYNRLYYRIFNKK